MSWNAPYTWPEAHLTTATDLNTQVRDNQNALIMTCRGVRTSAASVVGNSVFSFDSALRNPPSTMWSAGAAPRITAPIAGRYRVQGRMAGSSTTTATLNIRKNGTTIVVAGSSGTAALIAGETDIALAAADYLELWLVNSGTYTLGSWPGVPGLFADLSVRWVAP